MYDDAVPIANSESKERGMRNVAIVGACLFVVTQLTLHGAVAEEVVASQSLTIQPSGPRTGDAGKKYFNIEGKDNDRFASFGVLVFEMPKKIESSKIKSVSLALVQSVPGFAKDGDVTVYLAPELDPAADLKFDAKSDNGIGENVKPVHELASGTFKKVKTGEKQSFALKLDDKNRGLFAKGGQLCVVIVPADATVAATFFGAGESEEGSRPRLIVELP
jgi:hypothetical protein